jgi:hypothetical protein
MQHHKGKYKNQSQPSPRQDQEVTIIRVHKTGGASKQPATQASDDETHTKRSAR